MPLLPQVLVTLSSVVATQRDAGVLKRFMASPLPMGVYVAAKMGFAMMVAFMVTPLTLIVGVVAYHIPIVLHSGTTLFLAVMVGSSAFAALGLLVAAWLPNASTVFVATNALSLPLLFASNIFIPFHSPPWLGLFPVKPLGSAVHAAMLGTGLVSGRVCEDFGLLLAWSLIATTGAAWSYVRTR